MSKELLVPEVIINKPDIPENWDYKESVKKVKGLLKEKEDIIDEIKIKFKIGRNKAIEILEQKKRLIYFIQAENKLIKIGNCFNIQERLSTFQIGSSEKLTLIGFIESKSITEKELHKKFNYCRSHGEWFFPDKMLLKFINNKGIKL